MRRLQMLSLHLPVNRNDIGQSSQGVVKAAAPEAVFLVVVVVVAEVVIMMMMIIKMKAMMMNTTTTTMIMMTMMMMMMPMLGWMTGTTAWSALKDTTRSRLILMLTGDTPNNEADYM